MQPTITKRTPRGLTLLACLTTVVALSQTAPSPYTWTPVNPALAAARADACGTALPDGTAIISGGIGTSGSALASTEAFKKDTGFGPAPAMNEARASHTCTTLKDGRILVIGGTDGQGNPIGTAEIFDPAAQAWYEAADLNDPRWGHTATLLQDGRVLIAGGQDGAGPRASLEIYDPTAYSFSTVPASLSMPRINFAATLFPDGLVALMGGSDGVNSLFAVDIFDPTANTIVAGAPLLAARSFLSASVLPDGTILVAGGYDGTKDLSSAEIYDEHKGSTFTAGNLNTARHGHLGITLPGNGNVLIMAGISADTTLATCERYNFSPGTFDTVGSLASPRARTSAVPVGNGLLLSAGGVSTDGVTPIDKSGVLESPGIRVLLLPQPDSSFMDLGYFGPAPVTSYINVESNGAWPPGQTVNLQLAITNKLGTEVIVLGPTSTDSNGSITTTIHNIPIHSGLWSVTATNQAAAGAPIVVTSTPFAVVASSVTLAASCNPCSFGQVVTISATVKPSQPSLYDAPPPGPIDDVFFANDNLIGLGLFGPLVQSTGVAIVSTTLPPGHNNLFGALQTQNDAYLATMSAFTPIVVNVPTSISVSSSPNPGVQGSNVTLKAMVTFNSPGFMTAPTGSVEFFDGATSLGTGAIGSANLTSGFASGTLTCTTSGVVSLLAPCKLFPGAHNITAVYKGDNNYGNSGASASMPFQVKMQLASISMTASPNPATFGQPVDLRYVVKGVAGQPAPTGSVTFLDEVPPELQPRVLGIAIANNSPGINVGQFSKGTHTLTMRYSGDSNYLAATSAAVIVTVN